MQVDNQTLTSIIQQAIKTSPPDYVGWSLGITGIIVGLISIYITIKIYQEQKKLEGKMLSIEKDYVFISFREISVSFLKMQLYLKDFLKEIKDVNDENERIEIIKKTINDIKPNFLLIINELEKSVEFTKGKIELESYVLLNTIVSQSKIFLEYNPRLDSDMWINNAKGILVDINSIHEKIPQTDFHYFPKWEFD